MPNIYIPENDPERARYEMNTLKIGARELEAQIKELKIEIDMGARSLEHVVSQHRERVPDCKGCEKAHMLLALYRRRAVEGLELAGATSTSYLIGIITPGGPTALGFFLDALEKDSKREASSCNERDRLGEAVV